MASSGERLDHPLQERTIEVDAYIFQLFIADDNELCRMLQVRIPFGCTTHVSSVAS
jgi:hypothetical protein